MRETVSRHVRRALKILSIGAAMIAAIPVVIVILFARAGRNYR